MFITIKRIIEWVFLFIMFLFITLFLYEIFILLDDLISPIDKYKEPNGKAIKVIDMYGTSGDTYLNDFLHRLQIYYWIGE